MDDNLMKQKMAEREMWNAKFQAARTEDEKMAVKKMYIDANRVPIAASNYSVEQLEALRKKTLLLFISLPIAGFLIGAVIFAIVNMYFPGIDTKYSLIVAALACIPGILSYMKYKNAFKGSFVLSALAKVFTNVFYGNQGLARETIAYTEMMYMGDRFASDDYVSGKYKDVKFEQSHISIYERTTDSEGKQTETTLFSGVWMIFDFNRSFSKNIKVIQKGFDGTNAAGKYKVVQLEDIYFNDNFRVYAQMEVEAFYILTPPVMEAIIALDKQTKGELLLGFINNQLHVAIQGPSTAFDPKLFSKIDAAKIEENLLREIRLTTQFVDVLKLNENIFKVGE